MGSMQEYNASVAATRAALSQNPAVVEILRFATLAANGHNTQPWRFRIGEDRIEILPDLARRTPVVDPDDHHLFLSLGCAHLRPELAALVSMPGRRPDIVMRFGYGPTLPYSVRRPAIIVA